jgi:hypothetical protein
VGVTEEAGKAVSGFVTVMGTQPLALALVVMNLTLLGYLFYLNSSVNAQRKESVDLIIGWQKETDKLMVNCVSAEVNRSMMDNMQKITETMLNAEQKEIQRMQDVLNNERQKSWELRQREQKELDELKKQQPQDTPPRLQRMSTYSSFFPLPPVPNTSPVLFHLNPERK